MERRPEFTIEYLSPGSLVVNPLQFRRHPERQREALAASVEEHGYLSAPILNKRTGHLLDGHARVELALAKKEQTIPVRVVDVDIEQERRILRVFDAVGSLAEEDDEILDRLIKEINDSDLERLFSGLDEGGGSGLLPDADPDEVPTDVETRCQAGDLWLLGEHRLLCGDCTVAADVERLLGGQAPGLMMTDPPYGILLDMEWRDRAGKNRLGAAQPSFMKRPEAQRDASGSFDDRADWSEAFALLPSLQVAYVWHASVFTREVLTGLLSIGFTSFQQIIWDKGIATLCRTHYWFQHEPCWYVRKKNAPWFGAIGAANSTVWSVPSPKQIMSGSKEGKVAHPTQKPVLLYQRAIENHTLPSGLIYDPFGGSGSAIIAAEGLQRRCLCLELEPKYCDVILARWEAATNREATLLARSG